MKEKVLTFIMGVLVGAIITTACFFIYNKKAVNNSNQPETMQMEENGQMGGQQSGNMEQPPEKPDGDNGEQPPEMPGGDNGEETPIKPEEANNNTNN